MYLSQETLNLRAQVEEKHKPRLPCVVFFFFISTRQTFNYFTFISLMNQLRELQKIMHFYFYIY